MKPVNQTQLTPPGGDCLAACFATLLGQPITKFPNFHGQDWWESWLEWMRDRGLWLIYSEPAEPIPGYWIGSGPSPRGEFDHAVVMHGATLAHDPHPDGGFDVAGITDSIVVVALDPQLIVATLNAPLVIAGTEETAA